MAESLLQFIPASIHKDMDLRLRGFLQLSCFVRDIIYSFTLGIVTPVSGSEVQSDYDAICEILVPAGTAWQLMTSALCWDSPMAGYG